MQNNSVSAVPSTFAGIHLFHSYCVIFSFCYLLTQLRTLNLLAKSHNDYSMLTSEEVDFFKDCRLKWADVEGMHERRERGGEEEVERRWSGRVMD